MSDLKLPKFDQIGILVKDIEKAAKVYMALMNLTSKINIIEQTTSAIYKGKEVTFKMKKIMQNFGGKQLEIVELLDSTGDHLYLEFLKEGKTGLHHLGVYTKNVEALINHYRDEYNKGVIQTGKVGRVRFYYLDTKDDLGYYLELIAL